MISAAKKPKSKWKQPHATVEIEECGIGAPGSVLVLFPVYLPSGEMDYAASERASFAIRKVEVNDSSKSRNARQ